MKKTITRTLRTRIIAAAMAFVAMTGTTAVMMESSFNDTSITAYASAISDFLFGKEQEPLQFRVENDEIEVLLFKQWADKETFREVMWGIYNTYENDVTLAVMNRLLPTPDNIDVQIKS